VDHLRAYNAAAKGGWPGYFEKYVDGKDLANYLEAVGGTARIDALPLPIF